MANQRDRRRPARKKRAPTSTETALTRAQQARDQAARNKANAESVRRAQARNPQGEIKQSSVDIYEQMARDRGYTNEEDIKRAATLYRERATGVDVDKDNDVADKPIDTSRRPIPGSASPLTDPKLYGSPEGRRQGLVLAAQEMQALKDKQTFDTLSKNGQAVYMGPMKAPKPKSRYGSDFAQTQSDAAKIAGEIIGDDIQSKAELMSWLAMPDKLEQIKQRMRKAGFDVQTYDDISKLWTSVVSQAADTYSFAQKKVSPWDILTLRGKNTVGGKVAPRTVTSTETHVDELDPQTARSTIEKAAFDLLGRKPTEAEVDDFISKAQLIAKENPTVTKSRTTINYDFGGDEKSRSTQSSTSGGFTAAAADQAAREQAMQSEDYGAYQAAGVYFPLLFDALKSPV